ncbi:DUF2087 domain-containing protein [Arthrobacter sp. E918]|uniref:DUF2087 domain-containing protein n=1 Tax=Arthrobacter mobilis TaxID=2724944 RepID=A0A7X6K7M7_9MICC|nr:DUF2087 domain-containing protein [Arthrobacter mobilis]
MVAALAGADARRVYAQIVLGAPPGEVGAGLPPARRERAIAALLAAGLVEGRDGGPFAASETVFREVLARQTLGRATGGIGRFLHGGRIERYPANQAERRELLAWIAGQVLRPGEDLTEQQVNERLLQYTDDVPLLRRYLVDFGLLQRTASGSAYFRPAGRTAGGDDSR